MEQGEFNMGEMIELHCNIWQGDVDGLYYRTAWHTPKKLQVKIQKVHQI